MNNKHKQHHLLDPSCTFPSLCSEVNLDVRLRKAIARMGYQRPTLVQAKCLPLAITSGRDLLVRARTGTGKTLAYLLPVLDKILKKDERHEELSEESEGGFVQAVILVPTRELCAQVKGTLQALTYYCDNVIPMAVLSSSAASSELQTPASASASSEFLLSAQEAQLRDRPKILVSTPAGLLRHLSAKNTSPLHLRHSIDFSAIQIDFSAIQISLTTMSSKKQYKNSRNISQLILDTKSLNKGINFHNFIIVKSRYNYTMPRQ